MREAKVVMQTRKSPVGATMTIIYDFDFLPSANSLNVDHRGEGEMWALQVVWG
jgi:hypothetical protein